MDLIISKEENELNEKSAKNEKIKICKHFCEKKRRQCKFNCIRNSDYCVEHLAFNNQDIGGPIDKRVICPLDPKHSVYEKNFEKHLKKCNSVVKCLGDFDVKDINILDTNNNNNNKKYNNNEKEEIVSHDINFISSQLTTYEELDETQLKIIIDLLVSFDKKFNLYNLEFNKLEDNFINSVINTKNDSNEGSKQKKHLRQISSIITHVDSLLSKETEQDLSLTTTTTTTLVELGAGRGKLSYWFEQSRNERKLKDNNYIKKNVNILLIERGSQRYKFDSMLKKDVEESNSQFERIRIDLKDIYLNEVPIIKKSKRFLLYGKHLCGIATDYSIRCLKIALEDKRKEDVLNFKGFCLAVCCHHKCEWESLCGKDWLEQELKIDSKLFYIIRSISSWATHGERDTCQKEEKIFGIEKQKIGRICKNLIDFARLKYLNSIRLPDNLKLITKLFYYIETDVTLENSMIYCHLETII